MPYPFFSGGQAYTHNGDWDLMRSLGLKTNFNREWTNVGSVRVGDGTIIVKVEVSALPAQFFRFTITGGPEDGKVYSTGSGSFGEYWEIVRRLAVGDGSVLLVLNQLENRNMLVEDTVQGPRCSQCYGATVPCESCPHGEGDVICDCSECEFYGEHVAPLAS